MPFLFQFLTLYLTVGQVLILPDTSCHETSCMLQLHSVESLETLYDCWVSGFCVPCSISNNTVFQKPYLFLSWGEMLGEALEYFFFFLVKVNSAGEILQYPTMHVDLAVLLLKEALWYSEEYRDSLFTNYLVNVKEITNELTLNQKSKQLIEIKTGNYSRLNEPKRKRIVSKKTVDTTIISFR